MKALERELELTTRAILAAEDWAPSYSKAPEQHAALIKSTAKINRQLITYFRDLVKEVPLFVDWFAYSRAVIEQQRAIHASNVEAYDVNVIVNNDALDQQDQTFIKVIFDSLVVTTNLGVESMVVEHKMPIGLTRTSSIIQQLTTNQLANLVGMKVDKATGTIRPNPNAAMNIDETTRDKIAQSIKTSINLGENQTAARERLMKVIADPKRADMIARTETVRAYATGRAEYAKQAGLAVKHWYDSNATDVCADNTAEGWIKASEDFMSGDPFEPAHPNCKCQVIYANNGDSG